MANSNPNTKGIEGNKWQKGRSGNPAGRPKKRTRDVYTLVMTPTEAKKFEGLTAEEVRDLDTALLSMRLDEVTNLAKAIEAPLYVRGLAMAILTETEQGKCGTIERLRERLYGKAVQPVELTGKDGSTLIPPARVLTKDEARELLSDLEKRY